MRCLVVGDIHGCHYELEALVAKAGIGYEDEIIALGDLFDRGPEPAKVLRFFKKTRNVRSLLGNHEHKHLRVDRGEGAPALAQRITRKLLGSAYREALDFMRRLPLAIDRPEARLVHGFWEPGVPKAEQKTDVLVGALTAEAYLAARYGPQWYKRYDGDRPLIVGHHNYTREARPLVVDQRVYGIDTGCCYGGALTGIVLPEFRIVTVSSRGKHWARLKQRYVEPAHAALVPEAMAVDGEIVAALLSLLKSESDIVIARLNRRDGFAELQPSDQQRIFKETVGDATLAKLLTRAQYGALDIDCLRRELRERRKLQSLLRHLNRAHRED
jgi:hypothetical protein